MNDCDFDNKTKFKVVIVLINVLCFVIKPLIINKNKNKKPNSRGSFSLLRLLKL